MTISGERTEQLDIFCRVTGFMSDFLSFIDVEVIRFFQGALQFFFMETHLLTLYRFPQRSTGTYYYLLLARIIIVISQALAAVKHHVGRI